MEVLKIYAIVETGGKQYKVTPGQSIDVSRLGVPAGESVELDRVLLIGDGNQVTVGCPTVEGARVIATATAEGKGEKIVVFTYKAKARERTKTGHRQHYTRLSIDEIVAPGAAASKPARKRTRTTKKEVTENGA